MQDDQFSVRFLLFLLLLLLSMMVAMVFQEALRSATLILATSDGMDSFCVETLLCMSTGTPPPHPHYVRIQPRIEEFLS